MRTGMLSVPMGVWIVAGVIALVVIAVFVIGHIMVSIALRRRAVPPDFVASPPSWLSHPDPLIARNACAIDAAVQQWLSEADRQEVSITSGDGLCLKGELFTHPTPTHRYVIELHGYTGKHQDVFCGAVFYAKWGFHVLTPDLRSHGKSEGKYIGMGWPDRKDMLRWINWIIRRDPSAEIVLSGVSMGAATVMMTVGEPLPANVVAAVADCGYTSVWDEFAHELKSLFHLPAFPIMHAASLCGRLRAGYGFKQASALRQIQKAKVPVFFIHGDRDRFVPTEMVYPLFEACPAKKELLVVEGAGHGMSLFTDPEGYSKKLSAFLEQAVPSGILRNVS